MAGHVCALRDFYPGGVIAPASEIVPPKRAAQAPCLHAYDRIDLRIETMTAIAQASISSARPPSSSSDNMLQDQAGARVGNIARTGTESARASRPSSPLYTDVMLLRRA